LSPLPGLSSSSGLYSFVGRRCEYSRRDMTIQVIANASTSTTAAKLALNSNSENRRDEHGDNERAELEERLDARAVLHEPIEALLEVVLAQGVAHVVRVVPECLDLFPIGDSHRSSP